MSAVLLCVRSGSYGATATTPIQMKTSTGVGFVGFGSQEIGGHYLRLLRMPNECYDFISLDAFFDKAPDDGKKKSKVVYFRSERDVDVHVQDRERFPYRDYELSPDEIQNEG